MKFEKPQKLSQIATLLGCKYIGDPDFEIFGTNEIHRVQAGDIVFVDHPKYYQKALDCAASVVLINKEVECPQDKALLISEDPFRDFNLISNTFAPFIPSTQMISPDAKIGKDTVIQPGVFIGHNVEIGENCVIHPSVVIYSGARIGNNCIIHAGSILGADAFYYKNRPEGFDKLLSSGNVIIEDNVDIGAACTIDRGVSAPTLIGQGTKIDNQVHIGHDTVIGKKCLIAAQVGIAGCVIIEDQVTLWGQVGMASGITIGEKAVILAQSGVSKSLEGGKTYFGYPAEEAGKMYKQMAFLRLLPKWMKEKKI